ncbi:hypothetical protein Tco_0386499 [Tanacetum coccineum]
MSLAEGLIRRIQLVDTAYQCLKKTRYAVSGKVDTAYWAGFLEVRATHRGYAILGIGQTCFLVKSWRGYTVSLLWDTTYCLNWNLPFELMYDASEFTDGAILGQKDENVAADHLSRIDNDEASDDSDVDDNFPGKTLMEITTKDIPWFAYFANYLVGDIIPKGMTYQQRNKFFSDLKNYFWEDPYLFKVCSDGMIRRRVSGPKTRTIYDQCHHGLTGGYYGPNTTDKKFLTQAFTGQQSLKKLII